MSMNIIQSYSYYNYKVCELDHNAEIKLGEY